MTVLGAGPRRDLNGAPGTIDGTAPCCRANHLQTISRPKTPVPLPFFKDPRIATCFDHPRNAPEAEVGDEV